MPGRGAHLHLDPECLALAERRRAFGRALRVDGPLDATAVRSWIDTEQAGATPQEATPQEATPQEAPANPERADLSDERSMSQHR
jgi:hypothetical protein